MEGRILLMLGLAVAATAMPPAQEELGYEEAVSLAIDLYNQEPGVARAFRLLEAKPQPEWDPSLQSLQELEFTVRETTCPPSEQLNTDKCDFKADGVVKECYGTIFSEQGAPVVQYLCETAVEGHVRVRRGIKKFIKKVKKVKKAIKEGIKKGIKKLLSGGGSNIAHGPGGRRHIA
ncbi:PREDICTED: cathelicidin-2-like [Gekko japonicus]|uniref:Vipericidin n=1 Tax=Gekko japonicus TaxID=146911 RepID=A0ABM1KVV3_GEKJA|nr:PREDICTED: cathelicidin-2-like [Gekko japonicus]